MNEFQKAQNAKILSCYNTDETLSELQKAEILDIEKGGKRALIGEKRTFGGREYIKTSDGWKFHGKGTGAKAQEHAAGASAKTEETGSTLADYGAYLDRSKTTKEDVEKFDNSLSEDDRNLIDSKMKEYRSQGGAFYSPGDILDFKKKVLKGKSKPTETAKTESAESTSRPKVDEIYTHPESGKKYRVRAVDEKSGKIKYKQEGSELTQETDIKKFTEMLKPASESPKGDTPSKPDEPTIGSKVKFIGDNKEREYRITDINDKGEVKLFNKYVNSFWISKDKLLSPVSESPKAEETESTDSHSAAEIKRKALEIMHAKGGKDIKLSDFTIRQAKQVIKEHEVLGSRETPKTEKVAEEKISSLAEYNVSDENKKDYTFRIRV